MTDRVDAPLHNVQGAASNTTPNLVRRKPQLQQLASRHHAMLTLDKLRKRHFQGNFDIQTPLYADIALNGVSILRGIAVGRHAGGCWRDGTRQ
jgi:hypothetical protein